MRLYFLMTALLFSSVACAFADDIELNLSHNTQRCDSELAVQFVNRFNYAINVDLDDMAWSRGASGMSMFLYDWEDGNHYYSNVALVDPAFSKPVTLQPGQNLSGKILLEDRFSEFMKIRQRKNITLYWHYHFFNENKNVHIVKVGAVFFKKCEK